MRLVAAHADWWNVHTGIVDKLDEMRPFSGTHAVRCRSRSPTSRLRRRGRRSSRRRGGASAPPRSSVPRQSSWTTSAHSGLAASSGSTPGSVTSPNPTRCRPSATHVIGQLGRAGTVVIVQAAVEEGPRLGTAVDDVIHPSGDPPTLGSAPELPTVRRDPPDLVGTVLEPVDPRIAGRHRLVAVDRHEREGLHMGTSVLDQGLLPIALDHGGHRVRTDQARQVRFEHSVLCPQRGGGRAVPGVHRRPPTFTRRWMANGPRAT